MKKRIAIFASGSGSNAESIMSYALTSPIYEVTCIICNRQSAGIYERANRFGIESLYVSKRDFDSESDDLIHMLRERKIEFIVLAGFLLKIPPELVHTFQNKIINIHPSLLPLYGGKGMYGQHVHEAVVTNNEKESGLTIHLVTEEYDKGEYLFQYKLRIRSDENAQSLGERILEKEHLYYPPVIEYYVGGISMDMDLSEI